MQKAQLREPPDARRDFLELVVVQVELLQNHKDAEIIRERLQIVVAQHHLLHHRHRHHVGRDLDFQGGGGRNVSSAGFVCRVACRQMRCVSTGDW
eukprot:919417-Rhodomonas_salina.9